MGLPPTRPVARLPPHLSHWDPYLAGTTAGWVHYHAVYSKLYQFDVAHLNCISPLSTTHKCEWTCVCGHCHRYMQFLLSDKYSTHHSPIGRKMFPSCSQPASGEQSTWGAEELGEVIVNVGDAALDIVTVRNPWSPHEGQACNK